LLIAVNQGHINVNPSPLSTIMEWLDGVVYSTIVIRELLSIIEKATILGYIKLPQKVKERLDIFMNND
jgi:phage-related holin